MGEGQWLPAFSGRPKDSERSGLNQGELVTIPALPELTDWNSFEAARQALGPNLSRARGADRYILDEIGPRPGRKARPDRCVSMPCHGRRRRERVADRSRPVQDEGVKALASIRAWARNLKRDVVALWLAARDPRVPWHAKALAGAVAAYALSPIDLIPDFIPLLGYVDDLLIVPAGIWLVVRLIPPPLMVALREEAARRNRPVSYAGLILVVLAWLAIAAVIAWLIFF